MLKEMYKDYEITLSDSDTEKLDKAWSGAAKHWTCTVKDKVNRKQMSFDVFGGSQATMEATQALYHFVNDAYTYAYYSGVDELYNTFGYYDYKEARTAWKKHIISVESLSVQMTRYIILLKIYRKSGLNPLFFLYFNI